MFYNKKLTATRLKELRLEKGYTMQEVAKKIDIKNRSNIYEIEHAKSGLNIDRAFKFSDLYNVSLDYIYGLSIFNPLFACSTQNWTILSNCDAGRRYY